MNNYEFDGWKRVNKSVARKSYDAGDEIGICSSNVRPNGEQIGMIAFKKEDGYADTFDKFVNAYEYYNCTNTETGKYAAFYIRDTQKRSATESLDESWGEAWCSKKDDSKTMQQKFQNNTGLGVNSPLWVVKENTYDDTIKSTRQDIKQAGAKPVVYGKNFMWCFTDGDHGFDCEKVDFDYNSDTEVVDVRNNYGSTNPAVQFNSQFKQKLSDIVSKAREQRIAARRAAQQQAQSQQPVQQQSAYQKPISPLGNIKDRVKVTAKVVGSEVRGYQGASRDWWGPKSFTYYTLEDKNGNKLVLNCTVGEHPVDDGDFHDYIATIQDTFYEKGGNVATRIARIKSI